MTRATVVLAIGCVAMISPSCSSGDDAAEDVPVTSVADTPDRTATDSAPGAAATTDPPPTSEPEQATTTDVPTTPVDTTPATFPAPPVDAALAERLPSVEGFTTSSVEAGTVPWPFLDVPTSARVSALRVASPTEPVGIVIVADGVDFAEHAAELHADAVNVVADATTADDGRTITLVNTARAIWRDLGGLPVLAATVPDVDDGRWVWEHDGLVFIGLGSLAMETYIAAVVRAQLQAAPRDPADYGVLLGDLDTRRTSVPGYQYVTIPVAEALASMGSSAAGDCAEHLYAGYVVRAGDADTATMAPEDLLVQLATLNAVCTDGDLAAQLAASLPAQGFSKATVGGEEVWQDGTRLVAVDGEVLIQLSASNELYFAAMRPFVERFVDDVEPQEVLDLAPFPIQTCLFHEPLSEGEDALNATAYVTDCTTPHQAELYHHGSIGGGPGTPYPGDTVVAADADAQCLSAFGPYVGLDFNTSRLGYVYFYPTAESWGTGDRHVHCVLYGGDGEELFERTLKGAAE